MRLKFVVFVNVLKFTIQFCKRMVFMPLASLDIEHVQKY